MLRAKETQIKEAELLVATTQGEYNEVNQKLTGYVNKETSLEAEITSLKQQLQDAHQI